MPLPEPRQLEATAPQVGDEAVVQAHAGLYREGAQEGLLAAAQDPDLDAIPPAERSQEPLAVRRVPHRRCRDCDHPGVSIAASSCKELMHRRDGPLDRVGP